jgi:hypothetical protein
MLRPLKTIIPAHLYKAANASPHAVIRQLPPSSSMCYVPLIEYTAKEVYQDGYSADDGEYRCWSDSLLRWLRLGASVF